MITNDLIFHKLAEIFLSRFGEFNENISIEDDFKVNYERNKKQINKLASEMSAAAHELDCVLKNLSLLFEKDLENYFFKKNTNPQQQKSYLEYIKSIYMGAIPLTEDFIMLSKLSYIVDPSKNYDHTNMEKLNPIEEQMLSFGTTLTEFEYSINSKYNSFLNLLEKTPQPDKANSKEKIFAKHYVLTYILDCHANGEIPVKEYDKSEVEKIGNQLTKGKKSGNTFYKNYPKVSSININKKSDLVELAGHNWKNIVLNLSKDSKKLSDFLKSKGL